MSSVSFLAGHAEAVVLSTLEGWLQEEARRKGCQIQVREVVHACTTLHGNVSMLKVSRCGGCHCDKSFTFRSVWRRSPSGMTCPSNMMEAVVEFSYVSTPGDCCKVLRCNAPLASRTSQSYGCRWPPSSWTLLGSQMAGHKQVCHAWEPL